MPPRPLSAPAAPTGLTAPRLVPPPASTPANVPTPVTSAAPSEGLRPPTARMAAARARYAQDGQASMSKPQILVALYERLVRDLVTAETAIETKDFEAASRNLQHAQDIVLALEDALDRDAWAAADQLGALYSFVYQELLTANLRKDARLVATCRSLIEPLAETWKEAALAVAVGTPLPAAAPGESRLPTAVPA